MNEQKVSEAPEVEAIRFWYSRINKSELLDGSRVHRVGILLDEIDRLNKQLRQSASGEIEALERAIKWLDWAHRRYTQQFPVCAGKDFEYATTLRHMAARMK